MDGRRIFGLPRAVVLAIGCAYLVIAVAAWVLFLSWQNRDGGGSYVPPAEETTSASPAIPAFGTGGVRVSAVEAEIGRAAAGSVGVSCASAATSRFGDWTCAVRDAGGVRIRSARFRLSGDGSYVGVFVGWNGVERPFKGCCVPTGR